MSASNKLTKDNKIIELYNTPVGRDTMDKVLMQLGISNKVITNPIVSNIKLSTVMKLAEKKIGTGLFEALLNLVNSEPDVPVASKEPILTAVANHIKESTPHSTANGNPLKDFK